MSGRRRRFFDFSAPLIFFGALSALTDLRQVGHQALEEAGALGYAVNSLEHDPIKVYPMAKGAPGESSHGGSWRPGVIYLRLNPRGALTLGHYLRHELMHALIHRTCGDRLPLWAEEGAALAFAGGVPPTTQGIGQRDIERMKVWAEAGSPMNQGVQQVLLNWIAEYGWPKKPCDVPGDLAEVFRSTGSSFSYGLSYVLSGRTIEKRGQDVALPLGSLLKIPYRASLKPRQAGGLKAPALDQALLESDDETLLSQPMDLSFYRLLLGNIGQGPPRWDHRELVGLRGYHGGFRIKGSIKEAMQMLRASLLVQPQAFEALASNGVVKGSTLHGADPGGLRALASLNALAKTGTVSSKTGRIKWGYLMVAWPSQGPEFLAVFRQEGVSGRGVLAKAMPYLRRWKAERRLAYGQVPLHVMSRLPRTSWDMAAPCPLLEGTWEGEPIQFSRCGSLDVVSQARGSRKFRRYYGVMRLANEGDPVRLVTDPESYADGVLASEASHLVGEGQKALRAVIHWNATKGGERWHKKAGYESYVGLCDTTHCAVFQGEHAGGLRATQATNSELLKTLDELTKGKEPWLAFSKGGLAPWNIRKNQAELKVIFGENPLNIRRARLKSGKVLMEIEFPYDHIRWPCETFRSALKLPSCPSRVVYDKEEGTYRFLGQGAGHGNGISLTLLEQLSREGVTARDMILRAYAESRTQRCRKEGSKCQIIKSW